MLNIYETTVPMSKHTGRNRLDIEFYNFYFQVFENVNRLHVCSDRWYNDVNRLFKSLYKQEPHMLYNFFEGLEQC